VEVGEVIDAERVVAISDVADHDTFARCAERSLMVSNPKPNLSDDREVAGALWVQVNEHPSIRRDVAVFTVIQGEPVVPALDAGTDERVHRTRAITPGRIYAIDFDHRSSVEEQNFVTCGQIDTENTVGQ